MLFASTKSEKKALMRKDTNINKKDAEFEVKNLNKTRQATKKKYTAKQRYKARVHNRKYSKKKKNTLKTAFRAQKWHKTLRLLIVATPPLNVRLQSADNRRSTSGGVSFLVHTRERARARARSTRTAAVIRGGDASNEHVRRNAPRLLRRDLMRASEEWKKVRARLCACLS